MTPSRNRRILGIVILLALVGLGYAGYRQFLAPSATPAPRQASVVDMRNEVKARETAGAGWLAASIGQQVLIGGGVRTGEAARARVDISDGTILRLGASAEFELLALSPEFAGATTRWSLGSGKVWLYVSEAFSGGTFEVETPSGVE